MSISREIETSENKQSLNEWREIVESIAALATSGGGVINIGYTPDGRRLGVQIGKGTIEDLANKIKLNIQPSQFPRIELEGEDDSTVITIKVEESPTKPVWAFNRAFKRVGRTNQVLSPAEIQRLMEQTTGRTWDTLPCHGFTLEDISADAVRDFLRRAGQDIETNVKTVLRTMGLMAPKGEICNGAVLLFALNPQQFIPQAQVKCARFNGVATVDFLDESTIEGSLLSQLDEAFRFITRNTRQAIRITGKPEHEVVPEYPTAAIREALNNAVCHRDYTSAGTVQVRIYDDRLEIWNPGALPLAITVADLYREHPSYPRNLRIAQALHHADIIEQWGTGTLRIIQACVDYGIHEPDFKSEMGTFTVRLRHLIEISELPLYTQLTERQQEVIKFVQEHGRIQSREYQDEFIIGERQASKDLSLLVKLGFFERHGAGPMTFYTLADIQRNRDSG